MHTLFWLGNPKGRNHLDELCIDVRIIKKNLKEIIHKDVNLIEAAQDRAHTALFKHSNGPSDTLKAGNSCSSKYLSPTEEVSFTMKLVVKRCPPSPAYHHNKGNDTSLPFYGYFSVKVLALGKVLKLCI
jgi:hypothetical protein